MATIEQTVEVDAPVDVVYAQWTQFEDFPRFMKNVKEVRQLDDTRLMWTAKVAGHERSWEAKIIEQHPNRRISWASTEGDQTGGTVEFSPSDEGGTRIDVTMEYEPEGFMERVGSAVMADDVIVGADLDRFKDVLEERRMPTGDWAGTIEASRATDRDGTPPTGASI